MGVSSSTVKSQNVGARKLKVPAVTVAVDAITAASGKFPTDSITCIFSENAFCSIAIMAAAGAAGGAAVPQSPGPVLFMYRGLDEVDPLDKV